MAAPDFRPFLRLQSDTWLGALKTTVANAISTNQYYTTLSVGGKSFSKEREVMTVTLAQQLSDVLSERGLEGSDYVAPTSSTVQDRVTAAEPTRLTLARFA